MSSPRKFRVWDGEEMHEPPSKFWMLANGRVSKEHHGFGMAAENHEQYEVMFATGLTDAEGNEIWEGDFVRCASKTLDEEAIAVVVSEEMGFRFQRIAGNKRTFYGPAGGDDWKYKTLTVIGNRYQNPELLKETG